MPQARKRPCTYLPPVVPSGSTRRRPPTSVRSAGMSDGAAAEDAGQLAASQPGLRPRLETRPPQGPSPGAGTATLAAAVPATSLGCGGLMGALLVRAAKDQIRPYPPDATALPSRLPPVLEKTSSRPPHTESRTTPDATGVSPTGAPLAAPARAGPAAPTSAVGLTG